MTSSKEIEQAAAALFANVVTYRELHRHFTHLENLAKDPSLPPTVALPLRDALSSLLAATLAQRARTVEARPESVCREAVTERMREAG